MVLDNYRSTADKFLVPIAKAFGNTGPDAISSMALVFSALAALAFYFSSIEILLVGAVFFIAVNALLDAVDGKVAKLTNRASVRGDLVDHVFDRYADLFINIGIIFSPYCRWEIGIFGFIGVFLASYMGTQSQALGVKRDYGGILGRADRLVLLMLVPLLQYLFIVWTDSTAIPVVSEFTSLLPFSIGDITFMEGLMLWFGIAGNITALQRFGRAWKALS